MHVRIKTISDTQVPQYQTAGAVGFDFAARETTLIKAKSLGLVPTGCVIAVPAGYMLHVGARSSTPKKKGLLVPHGFGVIDQDYCGDGDEILLQFYNFTDHDVTIEKGERVGQGVFVKIEKAEFEQVETMGNKDRGGFGSTKH
jgi:dUTP pyrophosphatase